MVAAETGRPWRGRPVLTDNPSRGYGEFCQLLSVGRTYGYSWTGPSWGLMRFRARNFCVALNRVSCLHIKLTHYQERVEVGL